MAGRKDVPYPRRLKTLIRDYQSYRRPKDFHKILELIDRLLIKIIRQIMKSPSYEYINRYEANEIYHTAIIGLNKAILKIKPDDSFSINKLSSYLNGYVGKEFWSGFSKSEGELSIEESRIDLSDSSYDNHYSSFFISDILSYIEKHRCKFNSEELKAIRMNLIDGISYSDICCELNVKVSTVRSWVHRAKLLIKDLIEKEGREFFMHYVIKKVCLFDDLKTGDLIIHERYCNELKENPLNNLNVMIVGSKSSEEVSLSIGKSEHRVLENRKQFDLGLWYFCGTVHTPRIIVSSSNIEAIGYDEAVSILEVEFKGGGIYQYDKVPKQIFESIMSSDSKGKAINTLLKGQYSYRRIK